MVNKKLHKGLEAARHPEWFVDSLLSHHLNPSDTVVVTGFWRSGTTWLLQSLARGLRAKCVFEPFHFSIASYRAALLASIDGLRTDDAYLNMFMPYSRSDVGAMPELHQYSRRALTSSVPGSKVRGPRFGNRSLDGRISNWKVGRVVKRIKDAMRKKVVTKFVRGNLFIPSLQSWFDPIIIHLRRDPRAIIASFRRRGWKFHHELSLEKQLLKPQDGRKTYFAPWIDEIQQLDRKDPVTRLAAYWALTEQFVQDFSDHPRQVSLCYEDLCLEQGTYLRRELQDLLPQTPTSKQLQGNSTTTFEDRHRTSQSKRAYGWKNELNAKVVSKVESTVSRLGMGDLLYQ